MTDAYIGCVCTECGEVDNYGERRGTARLPTEPDGPCEGCGSTVFVMEIHLLKEWELDE